VKRHDLKPLAASSTRSGRASTRRRWASARACATPILKRHKLKLNDLDAGKSTKRSQPRCSPASRRGRKTILPRGTGLDGAMASSTRRSSTSTRRHRAWHPVGASGARIVLHLLHALKRARASAAWLRSVSAGLGGDAGRGAVTVVAGNTNTGSSRRPRQHRLAVVRQEGALRERPVRRRDGGARPDIRRAAREESAGAHHPFRQDSGFIAGADVEEFTKIKERTTRCAWSSAAGISITNSKPALPDACARKRFLHGGRRARARLPLSRRGRSAEHASRFLK